MIANTIVLFIVLFINGVENSVNRQLPSPVVSESAINDKIRPIIIAHRGASGMYPEHTKLAYRYNFDFFCYIFSILDNTQIF